MTTSPMAVLAGKKRKRYALDDKDVSVKLLGRLHHGLKEVRKSVKKARLFETQKTVKKLKQLRKPAHKSDVAVREVKDLEAQLESLKRIDQEAIARLILSSKIRKDKTLSSSEALISALVSPGPVSKPPEARHTKVESKLLSSKFLAGEVDLVLKNLKAVLEPKSLIGPVTMLERARTPEKGGVEDQSMADFRDTFKDKLPWGNASDKEGAHHEDIHEANSVVDDGGWESGSVHSISGEGCSIDDNVSGFSVHPRKRLKQASATREMASEAGSTFLPSLSVGFVKGDSQSDVDEPEDVVTPTGKKNRRGQRARQAIWVKKYGKNAKHVKKRREEAETAAATGKQFDKRLNRRRDKNPDSSLSNNGQSHARLDKPSGSQHSLHIRLHDERRSSLHPSWEAKKKLKAKDARILPSQGKKIVF